MEDDYEEKIYSIMGLLSVYTHYYNKKTNIAGNLFTDINLKNKHSINDRMLELFEHIRFYKKNKNTDDIKINYDKGKYCLTFEEKKMFSNSLITLLIELSRNDWNNIKWNINDT